jgi:hypothetical protein
MLQLRMKQEKIDNKLGEIAMIKEINDNRSISSVIVEAFVIVLLN